MKTADKLPQTDPVALLGGLLTGLGGSKTTSNPGDTDPLRQVFGQTQAFDPAALLQAIFQQAQGKIPGIGNAYGNAVGSRRTGSSGVQSALDALLMQTTLEGQKQVMAQQQQNMQTAGNVAGSIAQATKDTTRQTGPNVSNAAKNLAMMQGLSMLMNSFNGPKNVQTGQATQSSVQSPIQTVQNAFMRATAPIMQAAQDYTAGSASPVSMPTNIDMADLGSLFGQAPTEVAGEYGDLSSLFPAVDNTQVFDNGFDEELGQFIYDF